MRILLMVKRFQFGGAENHVCELANALANEGHLVWLLSGAGFQVCRLNPAIQHIKVRFSDLKLLFHLYSLVRLIRKEQITIIHAHQRFPIFLGTLAAKWCKIPIVATVHGSPLTDLKSNMVKKHVDKVITIRESCYDLLKDSPSIRSRVVMIPNGIRIPASAASWEAGDGGLSLYYISRLDKHHIQLLKFFLSEVWPQFVCKYPDASLSVVGDGTGFKKILSFWKGKKFDLYRKTVRFTGFCPEVPVLCRKADLVMGVGRVAIESLVHGIPLLSVKYNHLGPIVTRSNFREIQYANFVDLKAQAPNRESMLGRLNDFMTNRVFYENEARSLQPTIQEEYNLDHIARRIIGVYREVI
jgi:glycosyltransferase involved in cell wall biosynthesis